MLIRLDQSELFTKDPDVRFMAVYHTPKGFWSEMWRKHKLLQFTIHDLTEYFEMKTKRPIPKRAIRRWLYRTDIYWKAQPALRRGAQTVLTEYFGDMEWFVVKEITSNIPSGTKDVKVIV